MLSYLFLEHLIIGLIILAIIIFLIRWIVPMLGLPAILVNLLIALVAVIFIFDLLNSSGLLVGRF